MTLIADILLVAGALGAAFYCFILGRRLRRFNDLETGVGGAVAVLSSQVDDLEKTLETARNSARASSEALLSQVERAEDVRRQLELQMASLHDVIPDHDGVSVPQEKARPAQGVGSQQPMFTRHRSAS